MALAGDDVEEVTIIRAEDGDVDDFSCAGELRVQGIFFVEGDDAVIVVGELFEDFRDVGEQHDFVAVFVGDQVAVVLLLFQLLLTKRNALSLGFRLEGGSRSTESRRDEWSVDIIFVV